MIRRGAALASIPLLVGLTVCRAPLVDAAQSGEMSTASNGLYNIEQATRGKDEYSTYCAACHGEKLTGSPAAPLLASAEFIRAWSGRSVYDLLTFIGTEMPFDSPGSLAHKTYRDIAAFLLHANQFPAGNRELPEGEPELKQILIGEAR